MYSTRSRHSAWSNRLQNSVSTLRYFYCCFFSLASQQRWNDSKQYDYTEDKTGVIDGFQEYRDFIGIDKLRATDYLGKLIIWHHQCHQQQRKWHTKNTCCLVDGHSDSICYATLLRRDRTHYRTGDWEKRIAPFQNRISSRLINTVL